MKKILELQGVQKLTREQQSKIKGAALNGCCSRNSCRLTFQFGSFCEPGRCSPGRCRFY